MKKIIFCLLIACNLTAISGNAQTIMMTVEGTQQGKFKGESMKQKSQDKMEVNGYIQEIVSPRDVATGMATGRRNHQPFVVLKPAGAASPQFAQAISTNEILKKIVIEVYKTDPNGMEALFQVITLENASMSGYKQYVGPVEGQTFNPANNTIVYDELRFVYQKITYENKFGNTMASDTWGR